MNHSGGYKLGLARHKRDPPVSRRDKPARTALSLSSQNKKPCTLCRTFLLYDFTNKVISIHDVLNKRRQRVFDSGTGVF